MAEQEPDNNEKTFYTIIVEGEEFQFDKPEVTADEIMELMDQIPAIGLILCEEDGSEIEVVEGEIIKISLGTRFKNPPRFKSAFCGNLRTEL